MKKGIAWLVDGKAGARKVLAAGASLPLLCAAYCQNDGAVEKNGNLLANPGFEIEKDGGRPESWIVTGTTSFSRDVFIGGEKSLKIVTSLVRPAPPPHKNAYLGGVLQNVRGLAPGKYELSGYFGGDIYALWVVLDCKDAASKETLKFRQWVERFTVAENEDWFKFKWEVSVPENTASGTLRVECFGKDASKTFFLDDIVLKKID